MNSCWIEFQDENSDSLPGVSKAENSSDKFFSRWQGAQAFPAGDSACGWPEKFFSPRCHKTNVF